MKQLLLDIPALCRANLRLALSACLQPAPPQQVHQPPPHKPCAAQKPVRSFTLNANQTPSRLSASIAVPPWWNLGVIFLLVQKGYFKNHRTLSLWDSGLRNPRAYRVIAQSMSRFFMNSHVLPCFIFTSEIQKHVTAESLHIFSSFAGDGIKYR